MRYPKIAVFSLFILLLLACNMAAPASTLPAGTETPPPSASAPPETALPTPIPVEPTQTVPSTQPPPTETPTQPPLPSPAPTSTPTPAPLVFDRNGYKDFAISRSFFEGLAEYYQQGNLTEIGYAFSPTGDRIAISACWGSMDSGYNCESKDSGLLLVFDADTGELVTEIPVGDGWPGGVSFSPDGQTLLYGTTEKVALWNLVSNTAGLTLNDQPATDRLRFPAVAVAPDGTSYAALIGQTLYVWDTTGNLLMQTPAAMRRLAYAPIVYSANGERLAFITDKGMGVEVYDTATWALLQRIEWENLLDIALSPDGRWLAALDLERDTAIVWDLDTASRLAELEPGHQVGFIRFNPAGDLLIISGRANFDTPDQYALIGSLYETEGWSKLETLYSFTDMGQVEFSQDGKRMAMLGKVTKVIYEEPSAELLAGYEVLQQFQSALSNGDYARAADLFEFNDLERDDLIEMGLQPDDLAGSFERLCAEKALFCYPVQELAVMGYDWEYLTYMVRLANADGTLVSNQKGDRLFTFYLQAFADGIKLVYLPFQR